ncbi:MAG: YihY/virulence factor BrkB family protein [Armatimonadetes bacterium]|nr:YihY/virulence factor BrkB family protein [Armatimonadota bacterium]
MGCGAGQRHGQPYWRFPLEVFRQCGQDDLPLLAAALAHFGMLTIVPMLLIASYVFGVILNSPESFQHTVDSIGTFIPVSSGEIRDVLNSLVAQKAAYGGFGLLLLLWICQRLFTTLQRALDLIWGIQHHEKRPIWKQYVVSFTTIFFLGLFAWLSLLLTPFLTGLQSDGWLAWLLGPEVHISDLVALLSWTGSTLVSVALMFLVYRLLPSARVRSRSAIVGALVAGALWELAKFLFTWYVGRRVNPKAIYGAMGGIVVVMFWTYLSSLVLLFGAEVVSCHAAWIAEQPVVVDEDQAAPEPEPEPQPEPSANGDVLAV